MDINQFLNWDIKPVLPELKLFSLSVFVFIILCCQINWIGLILKDAMCISRKKVYKRKHFKFSFQFWTLISSSTFFSRCKTFSLSLCVCVCVCVRVCVWVCVCVCVGVWIHFTLGLRLKVQCAAAEKGM